jgi:hypothetical protein
MLLLIYAAPAESAKWGREVMGKSSRAGVHAAVAAVFACICPSPALATETQVIGKILQTQGHVVPACRMVLLRRSSDGTSLWFRVPDTGSDNSILAVTLTALTTGLSVMIDYDDSVTSGCGTEPRIGYISLISGG